MGNCLRKQRNLNTQGGQAGFTNVVNTIGEDAPPSYDEAMAGPTSTPTAPAASPIQTSGSSRILVAAIDFGTTFSGYAFSFRHQYQSDPLKISVNLWQHSNGLSNKAPTAVLIDRHLKVKAFGYEAEQEYADIIQTNKVNNWHYFHRFKMTLYQEESLTIHTTLADISGKKLLAIDVFSGVISYIKGHLLQTLSGMDTLGCIAETSIHWVLTVPAIWNDKAKQFMRKAAQRAGIENERLTLALEPEAASLFCRCLPTFNAAALASISANQYQQMDKGTKYMILDLGGGTVDVTVHEIQSDGTLQELHQASGGYWGGTTVDQKFYSVIKSIFGQDILKQFRKHHPHEMVELQTEFEVKKRLFTPDQIKPVILRVPVGLVEVYEETAENKFSEAIEDSQYQGQIEIRKDKMFISAELFSEFFAGSVSCIVNHIAELIQQPTLADISIILLIGGYSDCNVVKQTVINTFPNLRIVHPDDSGLAVLKGAVLFGHEPRAISSRICKYTYGIAMTLPFKDGVHPEERKREVGDGVIVCDDIYDIHLRIGQKVKLGEDQPEKEYRLMRGQTKGVLDVFASSEPNPRFVSDDHCTSLGFVLIENEGGVEGTGKIFVKLVYGGTELGVEAREEKTGKTIKAIFDFLG